MRGIGTIIVTLMTVMAMCFSASASQVESIDTGHIIVESCVVEAHPVASAATETETSKPWYEAAWDGVCGAASTCGDAVVDAGCAVGDGVKYVAGSYLLWCADVNGKVAAWCQETGSGLVG